MRKMNEGQLPLLELPPVAKRRRAHPRPPMPPALIAKHCNALLAELDRIAVDEEARATHLAQLYMAVERAHESPLREASAASVA